MAQQKQVFAEQVIVVDERLILVQSHTQAGLWHEVRNGQCDCKSYQYRGSCAHRKAALRATAEVVRSDEAPVVAPTTDASGLYLKTERPAAPRRPMRSFEEFMSSYTA